MKTYHVQTVCWPFDKLFPGRPFVFGDFVNGHGQKAEAYIGEIRLSKLMRSAGGKRTLRLAIHESSFGPSVVSYDHWSWMMLQNKETLGVYWHGMNQAEFLLKPGEHALDGAMRIARGFFKLINLRTESLAHDFEDLLPHFVTYEITQVFVAGKATESLEGWLRQKHNLKPSPLNQWTLDWLYTPWRFGVSDTQHAHYLCCRYGEKTLEFNFPDMETRLVYCQPCRRYWFRPDLSSKKWIMVDENTAQVIKLQWGLRILEEPKIVHQYFTSDW